jgi:hypothetical protein
MMMSTRTALHAVACPLIGGSTGDVDLSEYLIVAGGRLAGTGAHSYAVSG